MALVEQIQEFVQRLTPLTRGSLLTELERLETRDDDPLSSADILDKLRTELRKDPLAQNRGGVPARYFFAPLEPFLIEGAPEHACTGRIMRGSLFAIWEWISRDLLPTMTRDYIKKIEELVAADKPRDAAQAVTTFQTKVVKSLESTLSSPDVVNQIRAKLAVYTASPTVYDDLTKMQRVLRVREALAKFNAALPAAIPNFDDAQAAKITKLLDAFRKAQPEDIAFALTLVANRLKTSWQLIRLATKAAPSKNAADIAATPYAIAVSMVLERLEDKRAALRVSLRNNRILVSKEILADIYDTEYALQVRIDLLDQSDWGARLHHLMNATKILVEAEVARFPDNVGHVLGSRRLRSHNSLAGRLTYLAWKGRDVLSDGASFCKRLIGQS